MCGINGAVHPGASDLRALITLMRDTLSHRGPDDAGAETWMDHGVALANRRLAIIDLSPNGHNPMPNEDETVWITFNGEIYNYQTLRSELEQKGHIFRSNTDTEVIIHAYEEWGDNHVLRLRGMFAYALYDRRPLTDGKSYRLLLVRDRLGIKPLYYYWDGECFLFGSEIKAINAYSDVDRTIDRSALFDYLTYGYIPEPKTAYKSIRKVLPGHTLVFDGEEPQIQQYWDVPVERTVVTHDMEEAVDATRAALDEAVRLHMISDVPVGLFLSGGIDSSSVLAYMAQLTNETLHTFSIGFDVTQHNETDYARLAAETFRTSHHERIVEHGHVPELLPLVVETYDEPFADTSVIPTLRVSQFASEQIKVVLSGDGGDEVFTGYNWYDIWMKRQMLRKQIPGFIRRYALAPLGRNWPTKRKRSWKHLLEGMDTDPLDQYAYLRELFTPREKRLLVGEEWSADFKGYDDYWYFREYWHSELDPLTRIQYLDLKTYLPADILTKADRASMSVSLELRPPLLDHVLIETVFQIPSSIRFHNQEKKYLLKRAVNNLLPQAILTRGKKGFGSPMRQWFDAQSDWVDEYYLQSLPLLHIEALKQIGRGAWGSKQWALLLFEHWHRVQSHMPVSA